MCWICGESVKVWFSIGVGMLIKIKKLIYEIAKKNHEDEIESIENKEDNIDFINPYLKKVEDIIKKMGGNKIQFASGECYENIEEQIIEYANKSKKPFYVINDPYHDFAGWTVSGYILFQYPKTPKHPSNIEGGLNKLVEDLSNLKYDALADFMTKLSEKLNKDSTADKERNRPRLAKQLKYAAKYVGNAWKICEPFMASSKATSLP